MIDYLQLWNANKIGERLIKTTLLNKKGPELSAVEPNFYSERFIKVICGKMITAARHYKEEEEFRSSMDKRFSNLVR